MSKRKIAISVLLTVFLLAVFAFDVVSAQVTIPQPTGTAGNPFGIPANQGFSAIVRRVLDLALQVLGIIAIAFIIYGGFRYLTAGGNEDAAESGKKILTNAIIGFVIILMSWVILQVVQTALITGTV